MLHLKDSTGVSWNEDFDDDPDDTANPCGGLAGMSPEDCSICELADPVINLLLLSIVIALKLKLPSKVNFPFCLRCWM